MKTIYQILVLFLFLLCCTTPIVGQPSDSVWDYPVKPGTEQWRALHTSQEMRDVCQIPEDVLENLPTDQLAEICLRYPLRGDYVFFDNEREGIKIVISRLNGLIELSRRKDGTRALVNIYQNYPVLNYLPEKGTVNYPIPYEIMLLELLIADDLFINQLSSEELLNLLTIVKNKYSDKVNNNTVYSVSNIKKTMLLAAVIMNKTSLPLSTTDKDTLTQFIATYRRASAELITETSKIISNHENN